MWRCSGHALFTYEGLILLSIFGQFFTYFFIGTDGCEEASSSAA